MILLLSTVIYWGYKKSLLHYFLEDKGSVEMFAICKRVLYKRHCWLYPSSSPSVGAVK